MEKKLSDAFKRMDQNGDGEATREEIIQMFQSLGADGAFSLEEVEALIKLADVDGDGKVNFEEFKRAALQSDDKR